MKEKKWLKALIAYLALIAVCAIVIYAIPSIKGMLVSTYLAEQGEINLTNDAEAFVIRDEKVYVAKNAATISRAAKRGKLYKAGSAIVEYSGTGLETGQEKYAYVLSKLGENVLQSEKGTTRYAGYIEYRIDGAEHFLNPEHITEYSLKQLQEAATNPVETAKGKCGVGDPVFKVVKNGKYYLTYYLPNEEATNYYEGNTVTVSVNNSDITAKVYSLRKGKDNTRIILRCGMMYDGCLTDRTVKIKVRTSGAKGLVIKDKSIVEKDGYKGVLVKDKLGNYHFNRISVKADDGDNCIVYQDLFMDEDSNFVETISIYDEIVESPSDKDIENSK